MSISAMKQALEALDVFSEHGGNRFTRAADALRQAIAEAEKQEPVAFRNIETGEFCTGGFLRKDWAKWQPLYTAPVHAIDISQERVDETAKREHEPRLCCQEYDTCTEPCTPRGRHLAKREWVGLTEEEFSELLYFGGRLDHVEVPLIADFIRAIQAKLKEKNT